MCVDKILIKIFKLKIKICREQNSYTPTFSDANSKIHCIDSFEKRKDIRKEESGEEKE